MPSTYTLNNGIELIATGEQSGTWGDTTNTNLSLLDTALDGQVTVTLPSAGTSGSPNTLAIADGSASDGRNRMVIFNDGGDLGATAYVQLTPNDAEKIIYIRNDLAGSRSIILFQGTYNASNDYEVPAGTTAVVYFDGAGSGAVAANVFNNAYFDSLRLGSVSVTAILDEDNMASDSATALATQQSIKAYVDTQVGANNELSEVLANGNTTGGTDISVSTGDDITFADSSKAIFGAGSDLQIYSDGTNSIIAEGTTGGNLIIRGANINLQNEGGTESYAVFANNGAATLYYDNAPKLATTSTGINVTGTTVTDGLTVDNGSSGQSKITISEGGADTRNLVLYSPATSGVNGKIAIEGTTANLDFVVNNGAQTAIRIGGATGDITFFDTSGNASFVYDESAGSTFNEQGENKDFRVESVNNANMLFVDASADQVNIGDNTVHNDVKYFKVGDGTVNLNGLGQFGMLITDGSTDGLNGGLHINSYQPRLVMSDASTNGDWLDMRMNGTAFILGMGDNTDLFTRTVNQIMVVTPNELSINNGGNDYDFRVESDGETHMLFVDALNNRVGIGTSGPGSTLTVDGDILSNWGNSGEQKIGINARSANLFSSTGKTLIVTGADAVAGAQAMAGGDVIVRGGVGAGNEGLNIYAGHLYLEGGLHTGGVGTEGGAGKIYMKTAGYERLNINQYGGVIINEVGDDADFRVESANNTNMLLVDAGADHVAIGGNQSTSNSNLTVNGADTAVYASNTMDAGGGLSIYKYTNTNTNNDSVGLVFRVTTDNASTNALGAIRYVQPAFNSFAGRMMFQTRNSNGNYYENMRLDSQSGFLANAEGDSFFDFAINSDSYAPFFKLDAGVNKVRVGSYQNDDGNMMTVGGAQSQTYSSGANEGQLGVSLVNNTNGNNQHSGILFRVSTNNGSNNAYASIGLKQPTYNSHNSQFYVNLRSQSQNKIRQYMLIDSENGPIINDGAESYIDFRVESSGATHMLYVDAGNDCVNIATTQTEALFGGGFPSSGYVKNFYKSEAVKTAEFGAGSSTPSRTITIVINMNAYRGACVKVNTSGHLWNNGGAFYNRVNEFYLASEGTSARINSRVDILAAGSQIGNIGVPSASISGTNQFSITQTVGAGYTANVFVEVQGMGYSSMGSISIA